MGVNDDEWYVKRATDTLYRGGELEIDSDALVSNGVDAGAYVQAWVWVPDDEVPEDTEEDEDERDWALLLRRCHAALGKAEGRTDVNEQ